MMLKQAFQDEEKEETKKKCRLVEDEEKIPEIIDEEVSDLKSIKDTLPNMISTSD